MKPVRWKRIEALAQEVLDSSSVQDVPVPIEKIVSNNRIQIRLEPLESDLSGFLFRSPEGTVIGVNSTQAEVRQRFTLAHELGHYLLHQNETLRVDRTVFAKLRSSLSSAGLDSEEIEANQFAAEILMPRKFIERDLEGIGHLDMADDVFISGLARKYSVSSQAMGLRLAKLGYVEH